jgi:hypothetical protein
MPRTVIVGDVHGCRSELDRLLEKIALGSDDKLYFVGDLVGRGPDTAGVLKLVRRCRAVVVRGNHEHKLLMFRYARKSDQEHPKLSRALRRIGRRLDESQWRILEAMPVWFDVPEHELRIVHAGVVPGHAVQDLDPGLLMSIRGLTQDGQPTVVRGFVPWGARYEGPPHIVFGHNASPQIQVHPWATGIDTGCVYGGRLTAVVLRQGERMPPVNERKSVLVSVAARRAYCRIRWPSAEP